MNKHSLSLRAALALHPKEVDALLGTGLVEKAADEIDRLAEMVSQAQANEREACAKLCEEIVTHPPGHGGQWEGYGEVKTTRSGNECAAAIRARS